MERLSQPAIGPRGSAALRYGYVPPSLRLLRDQRRDQRMLKFTRLAMAALTVCALGAAYARQRAVALAAPLDVLVAATPSAGAPALSEHAPVVRVSLARQDTATSIAAVASTSASSFARTTVSPSSASVPVTPPLAATAGEALLSPRERAQAAAQSRLNAAPAATVIPVHPVDLTGLKHAIQAVTADADGIYGVSVIDLTSGQELDMDATDRMDAASVNKLEILAALYHQVEAGKLRLDQTLTTSAGNIQDYGTGVIRYQPVGTTYTLAELAQLLIEQSDNTASYMLAQTIGLDRIDALVRNWGLHSTVVGQEVSTPQDAAHFMALLYQGKLANAADTRQMLDYLEHTAFNDRIPAGLPANVVVAHKIGTQVNVENDVAIVALPGRPYILSVFAKDVTEDRAVPVEQAISRTVFQYEQAAKGAS